MRHELQGADGVGDAFEEVALSVCEVIHGISLPLVPRDVVLFVDDAIDDGVSEVHVRTAHVNLCAEHHGSFGHFPAVHFLKECETFLNGAVAEGTVRSGLCGCSLLLCDFFAGLFVDVGFSLFDERNCKVPELLEVVRGVIDVSPFESEPLDVFFDGFHIFRVFLLGVGVVKSQVADSSELLCDAEVHADGFCVSDVEIAVRLGREARLQSSVVFSFCEVFNHDLFDEVEAFLRAVFAWVYVFAHGFRCVLLVSHFRDELDSDESDFFFGVVFSQFVECRFK